MKSTLQFLLQHGYLVLFANVLAEQLGVPVPAVPMLLAMGALAGLHHFSFTASLLLATLACLLGDFLWYALGRARGNSILEFLCRISLEPDTCVQRTTGVFGRYRNRGLLIAKFVPGLSTVAPPLAGIARMGVAEFLIYDGLGSMLWAGTFLGIGFLLRDQLEVAAEWTVRFGSSVGILVVFAIGVYAGIQFHRRRQYMRTLRQLRVTPAEAKALLDGDQVVFVDLRSPIEVDETGHILPNAIRMSMAELEERHHEIPRDRDIILYCS